MIQTGIWSRAMHRIAAERLDRGTERGARNCRLAPRGDVALTPMKRLDAYVYCDAAGRRAVGVAKGRS